MQIDTASVPASHHSRSSEFPTLPTLQQLQPSQGAEYFSQPGPSCSYNMPPPPKFNWEELETCEVLCYLGDRYTYIHTYIYI